MAEFVNPYNFVRSGYNRNKAGRPLSHDRIDVDLYSGRLHCSLTTISRITTESFDYTKEGRIYGSSLKGMIRSVAETMAQACSPLGGTKCRRADNLCICCRVFGWLDGGNAHTGRVHISDALPQGSNWREQGTTYIEWQALSSPKPNRHPHFYPSEGRKFYYHHHYDPSRPEQKITQQPRTPQGDKNDQIFVAKANQTFSFEVDFTDLTGAELGLLLYALQLKDGWYHKFGKAKPLGFGTVKIAIDATELLPPNRYDDWDTHPTPLESLPLSAVGMQQSLAPSEANVDVDPIWKGLSAEERRAKFTEARVEEFFQHQFGIPHRQAATLPHWRDLDHLLRRHDDYPIRYPSQNWFRKNGSVKLPTAEEVEGNPPGDRSKWLKE